MSKDSFDDMFKEDARIDTEHWDIDEQPVFVTPQNSSNNKGSAGGILAGIAVLIFFIADLIAMVVFSKTNPSLCIACLGILFLVFGTLALTQTKITWETWIIIIVPIIGFLLTALPIADLISKNNTGQTIFTQNNIIIMVSAGLFIAGILMIIMPLLKRHFMLKKCTKKVIAKCIDIDSNIVHGNNGTRRVYAPKWEYYINGKFYEHQENTYTNVRVPRVGDEHEIFVNPYDANQIYRDNPYTLIILLLLGIMFTAAGILTFYAGFFA